MLIFWHFIYVITVPYWLWFEIYLELSELFKMNALPWNAIFCISVFLFLELDSTAFFAHMRFHAFPELYGWYEVLGILHCMRPERGFFVICWILLLFFL